MTKTTYNKIIKPPFYQTIKVDGKDAEVLDFHKIAKFGFLINVILSERFQQGKTFNCKEFMLDKWISDGHKSVWLYNTKALWDSSRLGFINNNEETYPEKWKGIKINRRGLFDKDNIQFCFFHSISQPEKAKVDRNDAVKYIIYDEFNEGLRMMRTIQVPYFDKIKNTFRMTRNIFILANQRTLANQLLAGLGIRVINYGLNIIDQESMVYVPLPGSVIQSKNIKNSPGYRISKKLGTVEAEWENRNIYDNMHGVVPISEHYKYKQFKPKSTIIVEGKYYTEYTSPTNEWFYYEEQKEPVGYVFALRPQDSDVGIPYNRNGKELLINMMWKAKLKFADFATKKFLLTALTQFG